jgi:serine/threonine protein kinase
MCHTLTEVRKRRQRLPATECVRIGADLARMLAKLHARGLVHRDIKPSNIILVDGVPKLADIGLVAPASSARTFVGTEPAAGVFALQEKVARAVVAKLTNRPSVAAVAVGTTNPEAYDLYLRGRVLQVGGLTGPKGIEMLRTYENAVAGANPWST